MRTRGRSNMARESELRVGDGYADNGWIALKLST